MEQKPENLARTIRAKRLIKKKTGEDSTLSTSEEYRLIHEIYSDSDEEDEQRGDTSLLTAQELRSKRKNSHEKNIRWLKQMEQDDNDLGMSRTPRHLIKILQDHWRDHTSQDNCSRENNREDNSYEQSRNTQNQDQNQNQDNKWIIPSTDENKNDMPRKGTLPGTRGKQLHQNEEMQKPTHRQRQESHTDCTRKHGSNRCHCKRSQTVCHNRTTLCPQGRCKIRTHIDISLSTRISCGHMSSSSGQARTTNLVRQ